MGHMEHLNVMIADDSSLATKQLREIIELLGHVVVFSAKTGYEALKNYEVYHPDIVTMDITMPDMDGIEATKRIIERFPDAVIIMVTAHGQEKMVVDALAEGARGYVLKPIRMASLKSSIDKALQIKRGA